MKEVVGSIYPSLYYEDAHVAIAWLERAFGFRRRLVVPGEGGTVRHAELSCESGVIMVASIRAESGCSSPRSLGGVCSGLSLRISDPDAHAARAKAAGAEILRDVQDEDYGSRGYMVRDLEGHHWYFGTYTPGEHWTE